MAEKKKGFPKGLMAGLMVLFCLFVIGGFGLSIYMALFSPEAKAKQHAQDFCETKFWKVNSWSQRPGTGDPQQLIVRLAPAKYIGISGPSYFDKKGHFHSVDNREYVFDNSEAKEVIFTKDNPDWYKLPDIFKSGAVVKFYAPTPKNEKGRRYWTSYLSPSAVYISKSKE